MCSFSFPKFLSTYSLNMDCDIIIFSLFLVAASGQRLQQDQITKTKSEKNSVSFSCKVTGVCWGNTVHWYQKVEGKPITRILYNVLNSNSFTRDTTHPQAAYFSAVGKSDSSELKIPSVKNSNSATYYCACWDSSTVRLQFGSGTTLYVTDNTVQKPKVTVYSASNPESNVNTLLCLARDMFPDLVRISWKIEDANGGRMEVPKAEGEQLVQRKEGQTTSMIIIDKEKTYRNKYICSVGHEWDVQHFDIPKATEDTPTTKSTPTCPFKNDTQEPLTLQFTEDSFQSTCSLYLASVVYTVMILKSMVYCCGLSLLLHHRILGRGPST
uniref:Ig-like domain-containing protein n=1 Tax=Hucho hucho TaxID=62062 RepID=A0A4W5N198_9TELE